MRINIGVPSDRMILQRTKNLLQFTSTNQMAGECFIQVIELPVCFLEVKFFLRRNIFLWLRQQAGVFDKTLCLTLSMMIDDSTCTFSNL